MEKILRRHNCFEDDKNASKRPNNWKIKLLKDEAGHVQVDGAGAAYRLSGMYHDCDDFESIGNALDRFSIEMSDEEMNTVEDLVEKPRALFD